MRISPDDVVFFEYGFVKLNLTIVTTWILMAFMAIGSVLITRKLKSRVKVTRWQKFAARSRDYVPNEIMLGRGVNGGREVQLN